MSAKKRTSLDSVFGVQELPKSVPAKERAEKAKRKRNTCKVDAPQNEREGLQASAVKQHTAYLPHPVHEQLRKLALRRTEKCTITSSKGSTASSRPRITSGKGFKLIRVYA